MRMFFTGLTDLFLILYLTSIASSPVPSPLTVDDFQKLTVMHEELQSDKAKAEQEYQLKLTAALREKEELTAKLTEEQERARQTEQNLAATDTKLAAIDQDRRQKEELLGERERLLAELAAAIKNKEAFWERQEASLKQELQAQKDAAEETRKQAEKLQLDAENAQRLADQMKSDAEKASQMAEEAKAVEQRALQMKEAALQEKSEAERKAREALEARQKSEAAEQAAQKAADEARRMKEEAEARAAKLAGAIRDIQQDSDGAYSRNVRPLMQTVNVSYEFESTNTKMVYNKELRLLPVKLNGQTLVFFPFEHVGWSRRDNWPPPKFKVEYKGQKITSGWINKDTDLIAVTLPGFDGTAVEPHPVDTKIDQFMPVLLSLRDNADVRISNLFRGLSDEYFVVKRDNIQPAQNGDLVHFIKGFRGTGKRAERILQGDQLVDLNGRLIGIASDVDRVVRFDSLKGWNEKKF